MPTATPAGGLYTSAQTVALDAGAGATIRYTLDGSDPTATSPLYASGVAVASSLTLTARAFRAGWQPSASLVVDYAIGADTEPPTVRARVRPGLNAAGWAMHVPTVSFDCVDADSGIASCTAPTLLTGETSGTTISGTAFDRAGLTSTTSVTVKVDVTPPTVTLTSPSSDLSVTASSITLTGTASDAVSGLASVTCNGVTATLDGAQVTCTVSLRPGRNPVVLQAVDVAGHSTSVGLTVTRTGAPTRLTLSPETLTLQAGEERPLVLSDDFSQTPAAGAIAWTVSDPAVIALDTTGPPRLEALAPGTATVTAAAHGLTATTTVTVVAAEATLEPGAVRWAVQAPAGVELSDVVYTHRTAADVPDAVLVETAGGATTLRGVDGDGATRSVTAVDPASELQMMGDSFGGVLIVRPDALERVALTAATQPWRYRGTLKHVVQTHDGTIFGLAPSPEGAIGQAAVVVLNGQTGAVRARVPLVGTLRSTLIEQESGPVTVNLYDMDGVRDLYALTTEGKYAVVVRDGVDYSHRMEPSACPGAEPWQHNFWRSHRETLVLVDAAGAVDETVLADQPWAPPCGEPLPDIESLLSDARGNVVVRIDDEDRVIGPNPDVPALGIADTMIVSDEGVVVRSDGSGTTVTNGATGTEWASSVVGVPVGFTATGDPVIYGDGAFTTVRSAGVVSVSGPVALNLAPETLAYHSLGRWKTHISSLLAEFVGPEIRAPYLEGGRGNYQRQGSRRRLVIENIVPLLYLTLDQSQTALHFKQRFTSNVDAASSTHVVDEATQWALFNALQASYWTLQHKSAADAVAFIGHGIPGQDLTPVTTVGIELFDKDLIKRRDAFPPMVGNQWINPKPDRGAQTAMWVESIRTQSRILFFASCRVGEVFYSLWEFPVDGALIAPLHQESLTDLYAGARAWEFIADALARGSTAQAAVTAWNNGNPIAHHYHVWKGDPNAKLKSLP